MAKYFIRKKNTGRIYEEGEAPAASGQAAPAPAPAAQPAAPAPAPAAQPQASTPVQAQQPQQQQQPAQQSAPSEKETKVADCINQVTAAVQKNDPYTLIALNIPDMIKQSFPDFATAAGSKDAMSKWEEFKKSPSAESFKAFADAFTAFGKEAPAQQQAPQQQTQQTAVEQQAESEYRAFTFSQRLNERLQDKLRIADARRSFTEYKPFGI